ncbi:ribonuclease HI family protein [Calorimonas adulescens]|jgi:RNase H.|uniref:Ribonuclease HI family protein n=1 Tax=Calorimonas adulescens TaxID=2606906 RepID=A0A5D8QBJ2_9THEO|nr:ribonuclease HI family protein [Calorimonas adulescens]TZE81872.1 ribonuclease HI family protein [Calorimonas adulescens]
MLKIHTDGGSRGNPGKAGIGVVLERENGEKEEIYKYIGVTTNNIAEYTALKTALLRAIELGEKDVSVFMDSELVVKQIKGEYKVRNEGLKLIYDEVISLIKEFEHFSISHIMREENKEADKLANKAMDEG